MSMEGVVATSSDTDVRERKLSSLIYVLIGLNILAVTVCLLFFVGGPVTLHLWKTSTVKEAFPAMQLILDEKHSTGDVLYWMDDSRSNITYRQGFDIKSSADIGTYCIIPSDGLYVVYSSLSLELSNIGHRCCHVHTIGLWTPTRNRSLVLNRISRENNAVVRSNAGPITVQLTTRDRLYVSMDREGFRDVQAHEINIFGIYKLN